MSKLDLAVAKEFNKQNPITTFDGMNEEELQAQIRHFILNGWNRFWIVTEFKKYKDCSLLEAKETIFKMIGELSEIFYTGPASTPTSVGVRLKDNRTVVIVERELTQIETGAETRRLYNEYVDEFKRDYFL